MSESECWFPCLTASDIGVPEAGDMIAYAHPQCPVHGSPVDFKPGDRVVYEHKNLWEYETIVRTYLSVPDRDGYYEDMIETNEGTKGEFWRFSPYQP